MSAAASVRSQRSAVHNALLSVNAVWLGVALVYFLWSDQVDPRLAVLWVVIEALLGAALVVIGFHSSRRRSP